MIYQILASQLSIMVTAPDLQQQCCCCLQVKVCLDILNIGDILYSAQFLVKMYIYLSTQIRIWLAARRATALVPDSL